MSSSCGNNGQKTLQRNILPQNPEVRDVIQSTQWLEHQHECNRKKPWSKGKSCSHPALSAQGALSGPCTPSALRSHRTHTVNKQRTGPLLLILPQTVSIRFTLCSSLSCSLCWNALPPSSHVARAVTSLSLCSNVTFPGNSALTTLTKIAKFLAPPKKKTHTWHSRFPFLCSTMFPWPLSILTHCSFLS